MSSKLRQRIPITLSQTAILPRPLHSRLLLRRHRLLHLRRRPFIPNRLQPLRINILQLQIRTNIRVGELHITHGIPHTQMRPGILMHILDVEVLIARACNDFRILIGGTGPDGVDAARVVVLVPGATFAFPDGVLDPFLGVLVEAVCYLLPGHPGFDVVALHFLDDLNGVLCYAEEGAGYGAVFYGPGGGVSLASLLCGGEDAGRGNAYHVGPTNMIQLGISGQPRPR
jgi:hypothetical protein